MADRMMTYDEAATALGRTPEAIRQLAKRKHLRRTIGNDGKARVAIPEEMIEEATAGRSPADPQPAGPDVPRPTAGRPPAEIASAAEPATTPAEPSEDARTLIAHLESRVSELTSRARELEEEVRELRPLAGRADVLSAQLDAERQRVAEAERREEELKAERNRLLDRALAAEPAGIFARMRKALAG